MRRFAVALLLILFGSLAWLALSASTEPELPITTPDTVPAGDADGPAAEATGMPGLASALPATFHDDDDATRRDGEPDRQAIATVSERIEIVVTVVAGRPARPVAKARVHHVPEDVGRERQRRRPGEVLHHWELPAAFGATAVTDEAGTVTIVRVPGESGTLLVSCLHDGLFGAVRVDPGEARATLTLRTDAHLTFETRGPDGKPMPEVPLLISRGKQWGECEPVLRMATDRSGRVQLRHAQMFLPDKTPACVAVAVPLATPVAVAIPKPWPETAIALTVPPLGLVDLLLVDNLEQPVLVQATLTVRAVRPEGFQLALPLFPDFDRLTATKPPGAEPVHMGLVGLGHQLVATARTGEERGFRGQPFAAPGEPGAALTHRLHLPTDAFVVSGRLLRADGTLGAGIEVPFAIQQDGRRLANGRIHTLDDGRFEAVLRFAATTASELELRLRRDDGEFEGHERLLPAIAPGTRHALGDVPLRQQPLLVSGIVVDDRNLPVEGAGLRVQVQVTADGREDWRDAPFRGDHSGADGRFALRGTPPEGTQRLRAGKPGHFANAVPLVAVGGEVRIVLPRSGVLRGTANVPEWLHDEIASLQLRSVDDGKRRPTGAPLRHRRGGAFEIGDLQPGLWDMQVVLRNLPDPVLKLGTIMIGPGDNRDGRLEPIDLTTAVFRYRLRALDPRGQVLPIEGPILARLQRPDGSTHDGGFRWQKGMAELITTSAMLDVVAFARGYPPTRLTIGPGDHDVYLEPLPPVVIHVPGLRAAVGPDRAVRISMILDGETGFPQSLAGVDQRSGEQFSFPRWELGKSNGGWLPAFDSVEVPLVRSGRYEVVARIHQGARQDGPQLGLPLGHVDVVLEGGQARVFSLQPDLAALRTRLEAFQAGQSGNRGRRRRGD